MFEEYNMIGLGESPTGETYLVHGIKCIDEFYALNIVYDSKGNMVDGMLQVGEEVKVYERREKKEDSASTALDK